MSEIVITPPADPEWAIRATGLDPSKYPNGLAGWATFLPDDKNEAPTKTGLGDQPVRANGSTPPFQESQVALTGNRPNEPGLLTMWISESIPGGGNNAADYHPPIEVSSGPASVPRRVG